MDDQFTFDEDPEMTNLKRSFSQAVLAIKSLMPTPQFEKFIKPLEIVGREEHLVFVSAPGKFVQSWVQDKYRRQLEESLSSELGERVEIVLEARVQVRTADASASQPTLFSPLVDSINAAYTFENFVMGDSNQVACKGSEAVANDPGKFANPFYIFGPVGVGKTHLAWAVHNRAQCGRKNGSVSYTTAHEFSQRFVAALKSGTIPQFHRSFESCHLLIIDDIAFVERGAKFQEELFHLFNSFVTSGRQLVLCSDRAPRELQIEERLRSRMESGLVADIQTPDTTLRKRILEARADSDGVTLDAEVCEFLAVSVPGNIRSLIGAWTSLSVFSSISGKPLDLELAKTIVANQFGRLEPSRPSSDQIIDAVARIASVTRDDLVGPGRQAWLTQPRHLAMFMIRELLDESWKRIGTHFGNRDHSSVIHAHKKIEELCRSDSEVQDMYRQAKRALGIDPE